MTPEPSALACIDNLILESPLTRSNDIMDKCTNGHIKWGGTGGLETPGKSQVAICFLRDIGTDAF